MWQQTSVVDKGSRRPNCNPKVHWLASTFSLSMSENGRRYVLGLNGQRGIKHRLRLKRTFAKEPNSSSSRCRRTGEVIVDFRSTRNSAHQELDRIMIPMMYFFYQLRSICDYELHFTKSRPNPDLPTAFANVENIRRNIDHSSHGRASTVNRHAENHFD